MNKIKTCFNCAFGNNENYDSGIPHQTASCTNDEVDVELFGYLDENDLPDYCENHKFKQEADT